MLHFALSNGSHPASLSAVELLAVLLRTGTRLTLSRGYRDAIQARLGKPL